MRRFLFTLLGLVTPGIAHAYRLTDSGWQCTGFLYCNSSTDAVTQLTLNIVNGVGAFIGALCVVVFLYGAVRMVVSRGAEGKEAGKKALIYAALGLTAALMVTSIIDFVWDYIYYLGS